MIRRNNFWKLLVVAVAFCIFTSAQNGYAVTLADRLLALKAATSSVPQIHYSSSSYSTSLGGAINTGIPTNTGGSITNCLISPALVANLVLNTSNCAITGNDIVQGSVSYTVTPVSASGNGPSVTITIYTSCFAAGTQIALASDQSKAIEDMQVGDKVLSVDKDGKMAVGEVIKTFVHTMSPVILKMTFLSEDEETVVMVTPNHPFFFGDFSQTREAGDLKVGDEVFFLTKDRTLTKATLTSINGVAGIDRVYNLEISTYHNYFAEGLLVHNKP